MAPNVYVCARLRNSESRRVSNLVLNPGVDTGPSGGKTETSRIARAFQMSSILAPSQAKRP